MNHKATRTTAPVSIPESSVFNKVEALRAESSLVSYFMPEEERLALIARDPPKMKLKTPNGAFVPKRKGGQGA